MAKLQKKSQNVINFNVNDEIVHEKVRIVGENIESRVLPIEDARDIAKKLEMDLIEINSVANPPIVRVGVYEKFLYEMKKNAKKNKQQSSQVKEIMLSVNISKHDLETKVNRAKEFISKGDKVRVTLTMKGRELTRREENKKSLLEFIVMMDDVAIPEGKLMDNGNRTIVILKKKNK